VEIDLSGDPVLPRDSAIAGTPSRISPISPVTTFTPEAPPKMDAPLLASVTESATSDKPRGRAVYIVVSIFVVAALVAAFFAGRVSLHW
jgi:hypothetical protein